MLQITFQTDGRVQVYAHNYAGANVMITSDVNTLQTVLPGALLDELRSRMAAFLDLTMPASIKRIAYWRDGFSILRIGDACCGVFTTPAGHPDPAGRVTC